MVETRLPTDPNELTELLESIPNGPAVFLLWPRDGGPYLARTNVLRRRLMRLLEAKEGVSRNLSLRGTAERLEYHLAGSKLESRVTCQHSAYEFPIMYFASISRANSVNPLRLRARTQVVFPQSEPSTTSSNSSATTHR